MFSNMFVNLIVKDLPASMAFFKAIGLEFNPQFTDETAACLVLGSNLYVMLLTEHKMQDFTDKELVDAHRQTEMLLALSVTNKEQVAEIVQKARSAGASAHKPPQDYGFMVSESFQDLDGHIWEVLWMDPAHLQAR